MEGTVPTGSHEGGKCRKCQTRDVGIHLQVGEHTPMCSPHASCSWPLTFPYSLTLQDSPEGTNEDLPPPPLA